MHASEVEEFEWVGVGARCHGRKGRAVCGEAQWRPRKSCLSSYSDPKNPAVAMRRSRKDFDCGNPQSSAWRGSITSAVAHGVPMRVFLRFLQGRSMNIALILSAAAIAASSPSVVPADGQASLGGSAIPGVCLLSRQAVFANAKVSLAATARLGELSKQAQAEIDAESAPVEAEMKAFRDEQAKL
jgi:hypothetical protein